MATRALAGRHLHGLATTSAWACCAGWRAAPGRAPASPRWAARTPASSRRARTSSARPSGIVRSAFGLTGQKCSALSRRLRGGRRRRRASRAARASGVRAIRIGDPLPARELDGPGRSTRRPPQSYERYCARLVADGGPHPRRAATGSARASSPTATSCAPTLAEAPARAPALPGGDVPADPDAGARSRTCARPWRSPTTSPLGLTAGCYGGDGRGALLPRPRRGRRHLRRTGRRERRPAPGPATSPSAAGRARAPPARRSAPSTTCRSTCASSPRPSWSEP